MSEALLQPAPVPLRVKDVYDAFLALCIDSEGGFEAACATAAVRGFEPVEQAAASRSGPARLVAEAHFRRPGFFFTAQKFLAEPPQRRSYAITNLALIARPASYRDLAAFLASDVGSPTATRPNPGVEYVFIGDPTATRPLKERAEGPRRFERGEGDLVVLTAWALRESPTASSDALAMSYQRSSR